MFSDALRDLLIALHQKKIALLNTQVSELVNTGVDTTARTGVAELWLKQPDILRKHTISFSGYNSVPVPNNAKIGRAHV